MTDQKSDQPEPWTGPVMLFDGVCNLCNAIVQWIIDRDPKGRVRFAALQSEAAATALSRADRVPATLPDSIVLVDEGEMLTRSSAAIRVARRLGFPYSMLAAGLLLPRPLRDAIYGYVARNRYRWFGRRDTCMVPTRELAARFLDAGEPRPVSPPESDAPPPTTEASGWFAAWWPRLAITYVLVYMAPFPLTLLAYAGGLPLVGTVVGWLIGVHGMIVNPIVGAVGSSLFGVDASPAFTGSGDMTFNYVDLFVDAVLAVAISIAWTGVAGRRSVADRTIDVSRTLARYYLGTTMLSYGWAKAFPLQFGLPGPDRLIQPYGDSSPMGLAWTFLGASLGYQIFAGLAELLGGYLLLWRRTAALGALVSVAVMTNVAAINFFYDVPVKLFSSHLVLVAVFILAPELPRLFGLLVLRVPVTARRVVPFWRRSGRRRRWVVPVHLGLVAILTLLHIVGGLAQSRARGVLAEPDPLVGIYRVESFEQDGLVGRDNEDPARWVRVGLNTFVATIQRATGDAVRMRATFDPEAGTLSFFDRGARPPDDPMFSFTAPEPGVLRLEGRFEGKDTVVLMRKDSAGALLVERGFRWINEFPFNR